MDYYERAGLAPVPGQARLQPGRLRLHHLHRQLRPAARGGLAPRSTRPTWPWSSVLSGNRNFEGRINPDVKMNYLASPPLVVAYALAGTMDIDLATRAARHRRRRRSRSTCATSGRPPRRSQDVIDAVDRRGDVHPRLRRRVRRRRALAVAADPDRRHLRLGRRLDLRPPAAVLRGHAARPAAGHRHRRARGCWPSWATR